MACLFYIIIRLFSRKDVASNFTISHRVRVAKNDADAVPYVTIRMLYINSYMLPGAFRLDLSIFESLISFI